MYLIQGLVLKLLSLFKGQKIRRMVKIEKPCIILSNHTSYFDFSYTVSAIYPHRITFLAADKFFYDPILGKVMRMARAIPKCLFQTDPIATIKAQRILKQKRGIIGIFPEGQISPIGKFSAFNPSIGKLIQKSHVNVYMIKHQGAYLINPPWTKKTFKGKMETFVDMIVSKEETETMSLEAINKRINEALYFNTSEYSEARIRKYRLNDVTNLESVIYTCPNCKAENLVSNHIGLHCPDCQSDFVYDDFGLVGGQRLDTLYRIQEDAIRDRFQNNPDYVMKANVRLESYRNKRLVDVGSGVFELSKLGYRFSGIIDGESKELEFDPKDIPTFPSDLGINIQIYRDYMIYQFVFSDVRLPTQFLIAAEYLYTQAHTV
ncbi:MAG: 1-acyl-sn-glycerol-3-phosphate acyltransferase [Bacilli bacterium]|nr:1-acyl-sn-glycerol-3-phosphate acyltransferase [Bacilli bacterium]